MGLVISEQIVQMFNGEMSFSSKYQFGSTFSFTFKLEEERSQGVNTDSPNISKQSVSMEHHEPEYEINNEELIFDWKPDLLKDDNIDSNVYLLDK